MDSSACVFNLEVLCWRRTTSNAVVNIIVNASVHLITRSSHPSPQHPPSAIPARHAHSARRNWRRPSFFRMNRQVSKRWRRLQIDRARTILTVRSRARRSTQISLIFKPRKFKRSVWFWRTHFVKQFSKPSWDNLCADLVRLHWGTMSSYGPGRNPAMGFWNFVVRSETAAVLNVHYIMTFSVQWCSYLSSELGIFCPLSITSVFLDITCGLHLRSAICHQFFMRVTGVRCWVIAMVKTLTRGLGLRFDLLTSWSVHAEVLPWLYVYRLRCW